MMQQGVLSAEEERGHDRVAELEGAMLQAIAKAESDRASGDLASFNAAADRVDKIEASLNKEIMDLHKRAIETDKAIRDKAKAEQDATKQDFEMQLKKAETAAPALVNALSEFTTEEQKLKFLDSYSKKSGIETDILLGEIELASQKSEKANLDLENIRNTIQNRNSSTGLQYAKFNQETDEKQTKTVLTQRILEKLLAKTLTKDQALDVWVTGGGTIAEFTKEFAEYI
jgi:multidrug efflux pump subunit AcrB